MQRITLIGVILSSLVSHPFQGHADDIDRSFSPEEFFRDYTFDAHTRAWVPVEDRPSKVSSQWTFHPACRPTVQTPRSICLKSSDSDFQIFTRDQSGRYRFRCFGTHPTMGPVEDALAYLHEGDAWISLSMSNSGTNYPETSLRLDRNVDSIFWTANGSQIAYCQQQNEQYRLMTYSVPDDDYSLLHTFQVTGFKPVLEGGGAGVLLLQTGDDKVQLFPSAGQPEARR